jgi:hypothetical protein
MRTLLLGLIVLCLAPLCALPEVTDSANDGFTVRIVQKFKAPPGEVYKKLVNNIGDWWNSQHTFSGDAHNLHIDEKVMGCFCEKLADGGMVRHLEVVSFAPGKSLMLSGGLGPLSFLATTGTILFQIAPAADGSALQLTYTVAGYTPKGMNTWAAPVNEVLTEQMTRFKSYVETGSPVNSSAKQ